MLEFLKTDMKVNRKKQSAKFQNLIFGRYFFNTSDWINKNLSIQEK